METEQVCKVKEKLQDEMTHLLAILRDILSSLHLEANALTSEDLSGIEALIEDRFMVLDTFNEWNREFSVSLQKLQPGTENKSFAEQLTLMQTFLSDDDFELILLRDQLLILIEEIQKQSSENHKITEAHEGKFIRNLQPLHAQLLAPKKAIIGVLDKPDLSL